MTKEKNLFERLTGSMPENMDYAEEGNYNLSSAGSEEKNIPPGKRFMTPKMVNWPLMFFKATMK